MKALCFECGTVRYLGCRALGSMWDGVYFSAIGPVQFRDIELPTRLPAGWARVKVHQCGLCASDVHVMRLAFSPFVAPILFAGTSSGTVILGHELLGTVTEAAEGCGLSVGQRVVSCSGSYRNCANLNVEPCPRCAQGEYGFCLRQADPPPGHEPIRSGGYAQEYIDHAANLIPVPDSLDDNTACLAEPMAVALRSVLALPGIVTEPLKNCLKNDSTGGQAASGTQCSGTQTASSPRTTPSPTAPARSARRLLVIGAGIQGLAAVHWANRLRPDLVVTCAARYRFQADLARQLGAQDVLEGRADAARLAVIVGTTTVRGIGRRAALLEGFDAVLDTIGTPSSLQNALDWTRPGGTVIVVGAHLHPGRLDYSPIWFREVRVRGVYAHGMETFEGRRIGTMKLAMELLANRAKLPVALVTHHLPLEQYRQAIELMEHKGRSKAIRIALRPS